MSDALNPASPPGAGAPPSVPDDLVVVGRVSGAYGVRGWIKVVPFSDARDSVLRAVTHWWLRSGPAPSSGAAGASARGGASLIEVVESRPQGTSVVAQVRGVSDRSGAEALKGAEVAVSRAEFPVSADGEYYWIDLIGCAVENGAGTPLGIVTELQEYGAGPVLAVRGPDDGERLIPFVDRHILSVDLPGRRIVADWDLDY